MKSIVILGAGFSGTMVAIQLMKRATKPMQLYLIEKNDFARGPAYADLNNTLLLNVRANQMGAFPDRVDHFYDWLKSKDIHAEPHEFVSRKYYGDYLEELLEEAIVSCKGMVKVKLIKDEVINITPDRKLLLLSKNLPVYFDELVLAIGLTPPLENLGQLQKMQGPLTIFGSGLSMVDAVVTLIAQNYTSKITVVSRRGLLPRPHVLFPSDIVRPQYTDLLTFKFSSLVSFIHLECKKYDWRLVFDAVRPHAQKLWQKFSEHEKSQFLRYVRPYWDSHRHRLSPLHHKILSNLIEKGQLEVKAIGFKPFKAQTKNVLRCEGLSLFSNPMITKLIAKGVVQADHFNLGVKSLQPWAHTIGALKRGELWETTAVPELRVQAQDLAIRLLADAQ